MKRKFLLTLFFIPFFFISCEKERGQNFIIRNNSDQGIIVVQSWFYITNDCLPTANDYEYKYLIRDNYIDPHSEKDFGAIPDLLLADRDTLYLSAYNRIDVDTMSCEEFSQEYPLKKLWKLTRQDAEQANWLVPGASTDWIITYP